MAEVRYDHASRIYPGTDMPAVNALQLDVADGEFMVLVGPSGSGKTTALRMLAGLEEVDAGAIYIGDRDVTDAAPKDRDVAMVFQNYALYPYLTVEANIGFPLKVARVKKSIRDERVREVAKLLGYEVLRLKYEDVAEFTYRPTACKQAYRMIVLRKNISKEQGGV